MDSNYRISNYSIALLFFTLAEIFYADSIYPSQTGISLDKIKVFLFLTIPYLKHFSN